MDLNTVKALLTERALARISGALHRFCPDPACEIVYFTAAEAFTVHEIRVPVWQKEPYGARMVCYCFGENEADIGGEFIEHGSSRAVERVREHIAAGRCACELRNPRGVCCLGDVISAVKRHERDMKHAEKIAPVAGALSALATLACCLPMAFAAGTATAGLAAVAGTYRWWFLGSSVLLIATGAAQLSRARPACPTRGFGSMVVLALSAAIVLLVVLFPQVLAGLLADWMP